MSAQIKEKIFPILILISTVLGLFLLLAPFLGLIKETHFATIPALLQDSTSREILFLTLLTSTISTFIAAILGITLAYLLTYKKLPFHGLIDTFTTLPLVLPPSVAGYMLLLAFGRFGLIGYPFYKHFHLQILFTTSAIVIAQTFVILPFVVRTVKAALESINPNIEKAAFSLGCSSYQLFFWVRLPLAKAGIISGITMAFARAMGEFGATVMVAGTQQTIPIAIYTAANSGDRDLANILSVILVLISLITIYVVKRFNESKVNFQL